MHIEKFNIVFVFAFFLIMSSAHGLVWQIAPVGEYGVKIVLEPQADQEMQVLIDKIRNNSKLSYQKDQISSKEKKLPWAVVYKNHRKSIFYLSECNASFCRYNSRSDRGTYLRNQAIDQIVEFALPKLPKTKSSVVASYGPGGLLFDLRLLTKLFDTGHLVQKVILIEPFYQVLVKSLRTYDSDTIDPLTISSSGSSLPIQIILIDQFLRGLNALGMDKTIELIMFPSSHHYAHDARNDSEIGADLIYGMDHAGKFGNSLAAASLDMGVILWANCLNNGGVMAEFLGNFDSNSGHPTRIYQKIGNAEHALTNKVLQALFKPQRKSYERTREWLYRQLPKEDKEALSKTKKMLFETNPFITTRPMTKKQNQFTAAL